jgi:predicted nucleic-acid-binding protein
MMAKTQSLPLDLVSLVHHVELAEAGWRRRAIEQIITTTIHRSGHNMELEEVQAKALELFGFRIQMQELEKVIAHMASKSSLARLPSGRLKLLRRGGGKHKVG